MVSRYHSIAERLDNITNLVRDKTEPLHIYCLFAAAILALVEVLTPHDYVVYLRLAIIFTLFAAVVGLIVKRPDAIPTAEEMEDIQKFSISVPCNFSDLESAILIAQYYFKEETIVRAVVRKNREINPFSFVIAKNSRDEVVGFIDLFGLRPKTLESLTEGTIGEPDLTTEDIVSADEASKLYIGGFAIVKSATKADRCRIAMALIYAMLLMLKKHYLDSRDNLSIIAVAYSNKGESWLQRLGFSSETSVNASKGSLPVYLKTFSANDVEAKLEKFRIARIFTRVKVS